MKPFLLSLAWVAACSSIASLLLVIDSSLNLFSWRPAWEPEVIASLAGIGALYCVVYRLAIIRSAIPVTVTACLFCGILFVAGSLTVLPERPINQGTWFARSKPSPAWYRVGRQALTFAPLLILTTVTVRRKRTPH